MSPEEELHVLKQENQGLRARLAEGSDALIQMTQRMAELREGHPFI